MLSVAIAWRASGQDAFKSCQLWGVNFLTNHNCEQPRTFELACPWTQLKFNLPDVTETFDRLLEAKKEHEN